MDGDSTAKTLDSGAIRNTEGSDSIHETSHQAVLPASLLIPFTYHELIRTKTSAGEKTQGTGTPPFSKDGAVGSMFKADGAIGGRAEKIGGPFAKDGLVGLVCLLNFRLISVLPFLLFCLFFDVMDRGLRVERCGRCKVLNS
jgi:hypothetical protein